MDSYNFLPDNEVTEVEGRKYLNPNLVVDETNTFIDRLRNTQQANMQQTATQTQRLGTDVPSNLGGLTGAGSYWSSRYVTPQTSSAVSNLRAAAQAQALNQALANEEARWKKRYQDAYNSYQKRSWDNSKSGSNPNTTTGDPAKDGETETKYEQSRYPYISSVNGVDNYYTVVSSDGKLHLVDITTGEETIVDPDGDINTDSGRYGYSGYGSGGGGGGGR